MGGGSDCTWSNCNGIGVGRSYLSFNTSAITHRASTAHIYSAKVEAYEIHAANGCTAQPVDLYSAGAIGSSTAWPGPAGSRLAETASARGDNCSSEPPGVIPFTSSSLTNYLQGAANSDTSTLNFGLLAPNEADGYQWKRFASNASGGAAAQLTVTYDFPPSTPFGLSVANTVACPGKPIYTRDTTPTIHAEATDNNPSPLTVGLNFSLWDAQPTSVVHRYNLTPVPAASNTPASWATNTSGNTNDTSALADGPYEFHASATSLTSDGTNTSSPASGYYHFTIDHTPPSTPTIASFDYPANTWGAPQGTPGTITFASSSDTAGFSYAFDSSGGEPLPADTTCTYTTTPTAAGGQVTASSGAGSITVPSSLTVGYHTIYVKAFDNAHNVTSQSNGYTFYVAPSLAGEGATTFEAEDITPTQPPGQGDPSYNNGNGLPVFGEGPWSPWSNSYQQHLVATGGTPDNPQSFTFAFTTNLDADYALGIQVSTQNHFGILAYQLDGVPLQVNGTPVTTDTYSPTFATQYVPLGGAHLTAGTHQLTVQIIGKNPQSSSYTYNGSYGSPKYGTVTLNMADNGYSAGIDFFNAIPINNIAAGIGLSSGMNNRGVAIDGVTAANIGPSNGNYGLSNTALKQANTTTGTQDFSPGATPTVDGVTFTMPSTDTRGNDNVMASGQTIQLQQPTLTSNIDMLVLSTCGTTTSDPRVALSINYADSYLTSTTLPSVPEWTGTVTTPPPPPPNTASITLAATIPYIDIGTTNSHAYSAKIYHLSFPTADPGQAVTSIVLPNLGSTFTTACHTPVLHILAMTPD